MRKAARAGFWIALGASGALLAVKFRDSCRPAQSASVAASEAPKHSVALASPGRVEGADDTVFLGAGADGVIGAIYVREGTPVRRGEIIASIACADLESTLQAALAESKAFQEARARLLIGSRAEERRVAAERTQAARAVRDEADRRLARLEKLFAKDEVPATAIDEARRNRDVATANLKAEEQAEQLVNAPPLPEEVRQADANVSAADGKVKVARDRLDKCVVRAPIDGSILRVFSRPGESFSTVTPKPIVSIADLSRRRVRAEIDERDVAKVTLKQHVLVTADAYPGAEFCGTVERLSAAMGRKTVQSGEPTEKVDRDILEAIIALRREAFSLPVGLRVVVQFLKD